jgi:hypothetical protein
MHPTCGQLAQPARPADRWQPGKPAAGRQPGSQAGSPGPPPTCAPGPGLVEHHPQQAAAVQQHGLLTGQAHFVGGHKLRAGTGGTASTAGKRDSEARGKVKQGPRSSGRAASICKQGKQCSIPPRLQNTSSYAPHLAARLLIHRMHLHCGARRRGARRLRNHLLLLLLLRRLLAAAAAKEALLLFGDRSGDVGHCGQQQWGWRAQWATAGRGRGDRWRQQGTNSMLGALVTRDCPLCGQAGRRAGRQAGGAQPEMTAYIGEVLLHTTLLPEPASRASQTRGEPPEGPFCQAGRGRCMHMHSSWQNCARACSLPPARLPACLQSQQQRRSESSWGLTSVHHLPSAGGRQAVDCIGPQLRPDRADAAPAGAAGQHGAPRVVQRCDGLTLPRSQAAGGQGKARQGGRQAQHMFSNGASDATLPCTASPAVPAGAATDDAGQPVRPARVPT